MADQAPFFIVGAGRSGTTLLRLILAGHSRLHMPPETWFLRTLVRDFPLTGPLTQPQFERAIGIMVRHERWPDLNMPAEELRRQAAAMAQPSLAGLIDLVYGYLLQVNNKQRLGDKTPHYFAIVPELATLYPQAKFIHLLRDGRDVAISWIDAGWQRYYHPGFEWPLAVAQMHRARAAYPHRLLEVRYELLVRQPEAVTRQICEFLHEPFEHAMIDWQRRTGLVAPRDRHLHGSLQRPLAQDAIAIWRRRLSLLSCLAMEACLHRALVQSGYQLRFANRAWRPLFWCISRSLNFFAPALQRGIPYLQRRGLLPQSFYL